MPAAIYKNISSPIDSIKRVKLLITGTVQAVGFRPFVYQLASLYQLNGYVCNISGAVKIEIEGGIENIQKFKQALIHNAPPLANPKISYAEEMPTTEDTQFSIEDSVETVEKNIHVPADFYVCENCMEEMKNPQARRYQYPLISCTQCGPRYTIIESLPYDRENTSLKSFLLCPACAAEYSDPNSRRYHAETISCHDCGPQLSYRDQTYSIDKNNHEVVSYVVEQLKLGKILAIKGIGGYHLVCDALNRTSISLLRKRKHRPDKPFAVMFPLQNDMHLLKQMCEINSFQLDLLISPQRPIVLVQRAKNSSLPMVIAPGLNKLGVLLPYSPLHGIISQKFNGPLLVTSGNISGEPVIIRNEVAEAKLVNIADGFVHHNRPILRSADDSVYQFVNGQAQAIRLGRGISPLELTLPKTIHKTTIALGALYKNSIALAWDNRLVVSPHIGNMDSPQSLRAMEQTIKTLQELYQVNVEQLIYDKHPGYSNTRWAKKQNLLTKTIYHHHAHASALAFEHTLIKPWLMFTWDGVGFGDDNTIWGGETMVGSPGKWQRISSLRPFFLPGGDSVSRQPELSALSLCWEADIDNHKITFHEDVFKLWQHKINTIQSSAMARLFDAAAALLGLIEKSGYDGHAPMLLESITNDDVSIYVDLTLIYNKQRKLWEINWQPLLELLLNEDLSISQRATAFHVSLAKIVVNQVIKFQQHYHFMAVGFTGGVFQNQRLAQFIQHFLHQQNMPCYFHQQLPSNDAAICVGQVIETLYRQEESNYV